MPFHTFAYQIATACFQAIHLPPFLIGAYIARRHQTSRRVAPIVTQVR